MAAFTLAPRHRAVVRSLVEALFHHDAGPRPEQLDAVTLAVEAHFAPVRRAQRSFLLLALDLVRWLPLLLLTGLTLFEDLPVARRVALLERMDCSKSLLLYLPVVAFKTLLAMLFFEQPEELRAMGYPGDDARKRWLKLAA